MKNLLIILLLISNFAFGQAPATVVRVTNATTAIGSNLSAGSVIINRATGDVFTTLLPVTGSNTINSLTVNTDIKSINNSSGTSGTYTPTLTNNSYVSASSVDFACYTIVGNIVHVTISGTLTATNNFATLTFSLPVTRATAMGGKIIGLGRFYNVQNTGDGGTITDNGYGAVDFYFYIYTTGSSNPYVVTFDYIKA